MRKRGYNLSLKSISKTCHPEKLLFRISSLFTSGSLFFFPLRVSSKHQQRRGEGMPAIALKKKDSLKRFFFLRYPWRRGFRCGLI